MSARLWRLLLARPMDLAIYQKRPSILYQVPWSAQIAIAILWWLLKGSCP